MLSNSPVNKVNDALLIFIAFTLPFYQQASIIAIILLALVWVVQKKYIILLPALKKHPLLILLISYFILHLSGMLWSDNMKYGWSDIETKLSFIILPVVIGTAFLTNKPFSKIKKAFVAGNIIACIYCIITSTISYLQSGDQTVFFYVNLSKLMHTTYFTFYLNLALLFLIEEVVNNWRSWRLGKKILECIAILIIVITIILLSARMAIAVSLLTVIFYCITLIIKFKKGTVILIFSLILIALINFQTTQLYNRYTQVEETVQHYGEDKTSNDTAASKTPDYNSTTTRIELWKDVWQVIKRNWLVGVGTGDIKEELSKEYTAQNFQYGAESKFNPHNQYLHTGVILGFTGILLLLCCLLLPLQQAVKQQNWLYLCFLLIIMLNAITESIIEVQKGIIFYAFFYVLFYMQSRNDYKRI